MLKFHSAKCSTECVIEFCKQLVFLIGVLWKREKGLEECDWNYLWNVSLTGDETCENERNKKDSEHTFVKSFFVSNFSLSMSKVFLLPIQINKMSWKNIFLEKGWIKFCDFFLINFTYKVVVLFAFKYNNFNFYYLRLNQPKFKRHLLINTLDYPNKKLFITVDFSKLYFIANEHMKL